MRNPAVALAATLALATACGNGTTVGSGAPANRPTGANQVVVQVTVSGGFVPVEFAVTTVPVATLLGDGTLITGAPVPAIYPGPAMGPLQAVTLSAGEVDALVRKAGELGLLGGELSFGQPPVADAPDTEVTIAANGTVHRHAANALGLELDNQQLTRQEAANRRALNTFVQAVTELRPGEKAWAPPAVAVYVLGPYTPDPQVPQAPMAWPLGRLPGPTADTDRTRTCVLVEGAELATLLPVLTRANARTPWVVEGRQANLAFRPVVPGQPGCP